MSLVDGAPAVIPTRLLYSPSEAERLLGISHATLYRLIRAGRLDAVKIGSPTRITVGSIERLLATLLPARRGTSAPTIGHGGSSALAPIPRGAPR